MKKYILIITIVIILLFMSYLLPAFIVSNYIHPLKFQRPRLQKNQIPIPPILYKTGPKSIPKLDANVKKLFKETLANNPYYNIKYFDDKACRDFIKQHFDKNVLNAYDSLIPGAYKADLWRYCVLYQNGGVYGDLTQKYLVPLDQLVDRDYDRVVLVKDGVIPFCFKHGIQVSFMAAVPKLSIFRDAINQIVYNVKHKKYGCNALAVTGPIVLRNVLDKSNVPYRLELDQRNNKFIKYNHIPVIKCKSDNHNKVIGRKFKTNYAVMWLFGKVFKKANKPDPE